MREAMGAQNSDRKGSRPPGRGRPVTVRLVRGDSGPASSTFSETFTIGSDEACDLRLLHEAVSPKHVQVLFDGILWWVRDLDSSSGTWAGPSRIQVVPVSNQIEIAVGKSGPVLSLTVSGESRIAQEPYDSSEKRPTASSRATRGAAPSPEKEVRVSDTQIVQRYLDSRSDKPQGAETLMYHRAVERIRKKSSLRYQLVIGAVLAVLFMALGVVLLQHRKINALRSTAAKLFYTTKSVELHVAKLEEIVLLNADRAQVAELMERRAKLQQLEKEYDAFVRELGLYTKLSEQERVVLHVARVFGECEVNVPKGFMPEVLRYVERWKSTDRLSRALTRAKERGYARVIAQKFIDSHLPPQYLYLALQESGFDERAVGPPTRYGHAKGMWQFISSTGHRYGLQIGPLYEQPDYDPKDERFHWQKATGAAVKYLKDLHVNEAQGSGMLAMASYNWGEEKVLRTISSLPQNPLDRNFWTLLKHRSVPAETYDYVLSIVSAAVICENPRLFGFGGDCPTLPKSASSVR